MLLEAKETVNIPQNAHSHAWSICNNFRNNKWFKQAVKLSEAFTTASDWFKWT